MKRKILSVIMSLFLILAVIQPIFSAVAASSVWGGGTATPSLVGGYYQIDTGEKLKWFANQVNSGSNTIKAKLTDDILLNSVGSYSRTWAPIGTEAKPFKGEFDGNGHYISGVYVTDSNDYSGLFGYVYTEKPVVDDEDDTTEEVFVADPPVMIHDLEVKYSSVSGGSNTGGICGYIHYGIIENCSYSGTVTSTGNSIGGICGYAFNFSEVRKCSTSGSVTGVIRTGGIVGFSYSNTKIFECFSNATVRSNANLNGNAGGIAGALTSSTLKCCYFLGSVTGPKRVGGIIGNNSYSSVTACYVVAPITSTVATPEYVNAVVGYSIGGEYVNCYYNYDTTTFEDSNAIARTLNDIKKFSFVRELNENSNSFTYDYMVLNGGYPVLAYTLGTAVWSGGVEEPTLDSAGYYLIKSADNLAWFAKLVNGTLSGVPRNTAAKAKVMDNILLNIFITDDSELTNTWTPIGSQSYPFTGTFIGNGYNIAGLYVNSYKNSGFFGYVDEGANISDVVLLDGVIKGTENVGGIAGYNKGTISLCCNDGAVKGQKAVGGIAGYNVGTVQTSYNVGTVECTYESGSQIGGIVGYNTRAKVKQCFNNGLVTGTASSNYYGGICGFNSGDGVYNCYNTGEILGGFYVGGLVGYNSTGTIKYCFNAGVVNTKNAVNSNVNNFIGYNYGTPSISYCYYDSTIEDSVMNNANGAISKTTVQMTGSSASYNLSLQSGFWTNKSDESFFRYYPQIYAIYYSNHDKYRADSIESVKIVKDTYNIRLKIDGQNDSYYADLNSAITAAGSKSGTVIPIRNISVNGQVNISGNITIRGDEYAKTIIRDADYTGIMFNVTGTLKIGDAKNGLDTNPLLTIDGNGANVTAEAPIFNLGENAKFYSYPGVIVTGNKSTELGGCIYMDSNSTAIIAGGLITNNTTSADGGAIYNDMGTLTISGGTISTNSSSLGKGGGIFNNYGTVEINGGAITGNYGKTLGGGIYTIGADGVVNVSGDALISENYANAGGAIYINSGEATMAGGTLSRNYAYNRRGSTVSSGGGGAVSIGAAAKFKMSGGLIDGNYVYNRTGDGFGVTNFGTFEISNTAAITNNDVFVARNRTIAVTNKLTYEGIAVTLTPASYTESTVVLSGPSMGVSYAKFAVTPSGTNSWYVNSSGYLMSSEIVNVCSLSKFGAYSVEYVSIAQAAANIGADETGIITVIGNNTINETIKIHGDVTILSETDQVFTSMRDGSFRGALFEVENGGILRLGFTEIETQGEDISTNQVTEDSVGGEYRLDGGYAYNQASGSSMVNVKAGGTLYTYDDFTLQNSYSTVSGSIVVAGTMNMYGGTFKDNIAVNGGAINVAATGNLTMYGGLITGNSVQNGGKGKAVYSAGTITRAANIYEYYQDEEIVATQNSFVTITSDNDIHLIAGKKLNLSNTVSTVLLSGTATAPESSTTTPSETMLTAGYYYAGMPIIDGTDVGLHYSEFSIADPGYYIQSDGTIALNLLVPKSNSGLNLNRESQIISNIDLTQTVAYYKQAFTNTDTIEIRDANGNVLADTAHLTTGSTINLYNRTNTAIADTVTVVIYGDVDCDGKIDGMDSMMIACIAQQMLNSTNLSAAQLIAADIDKSGDVTLSDEEYIRNCGLLLNTVDQNI